MHQRERSILRVEGTDDEHVIKNLLSRHGVDYSDIDIEGAGVGESGGRDKLLKGMALKVKNSTDKAIGFVLDANGAPLDCWQSIYNRLQGIGLTLPDEIPEDGFVGYTNTYKTRVGVWLMPDNRRTGALEGFLQDLVPEGDALLQLAEKSTEKAKQAGAAFPDAAQSKAILHTWLAWQERPGVPYGTAITAKYFRRDSPAALAFVNWFKRVFQDPVPDP